MNFNNNKKLAVRRWALLALPLIALAAVLLSTEPGHVTAGAAESCVPARPHEAGDFEETLESGGLTRSYVLHIPPSYTGDQPMPLVLNYHGLGGLASDQQAYSNLPEKADEAGFIVVAPQGEGDPANHNFATLSDRPDDIAFTVELLDALETQLCIDTARIFAAGLSNGAQMSGRLACNLSERIAAVAPVSGAHFPPFSPDIPDEPGCFSTRPVPLIAFHGTADPVIPFEGGPSIFNISFRSIEEAVIPEWAAHNGCAAEPFAEQVTENVRRVRYQGCDEGATVELYVIADGGHVWPGAPGATQEISASGLIWAFFQEHPLELAQPAGTPTEASAVAGEELESDTESSGSYSPLAIIVAVVTVGLLAVGAIAWFVKSGRKA